MSWHRTFRLLTVLMLLLATTLIANAQTDSERTKSKSQEVTAPKKYRSKNFIVTTDLVTDDAKDLLDRLENMLRLISGYWGRPNRQVIEMYVVKNLSKWPPGSLHPDGIASVQSGGGVTRSLISRQGNRGYAKSIVYATADRGTPQHEAVHAYCTQTFGSTGPVWYSEGMAEMGQYWRKDDDMSVKCHPVVAKYIRSSPPKSLNGIVNGNEATGDSWQNYAWRWALCHLLAVNPNYSKRFRPLGLGLLTKQDVSFEQVYGSMAKEISFEYLFFLENLDIGYRVDLCAWDWKARFTRPKGKGSLLSRIRADRGWQPSRMTVKKDEEIEFSATGTWQLSKDGRKTDADGNGKSGRLMGIVLDENYKLSKPFELGSYGSFTAPIAGNLYLRCQDSWTSIADNKGRIDVKIKVKGVGTPLTNPKAIKHSSR